MVSPEVVERVLAEVDKHVLASKDNETDSWINPRTPVDSVAAFAMARILTKRRLFDHCVPVAPAGHVYGDFFEKTSRRLGFFGSR